MLRNMTVFIHARPALKDRPAHLEVSCAVPHPEFAAFLAQLVRKADLTEITPRQRWCLPFHYKVEVCAAAPQFFEAGFYLGDHGSVDLTAGRHREQLSLF